MNPSFAQIVPLIEKDTLLKTLKISILNGDKRAYRDLGSLLETPYAEEIPAILQDFAFFPSELLDFNKPISKTQFLDFFYKNQNLMTYSYLFNAFFIKGFDKEKVEFRVNIVKEERGKKYNTVKDLAAKLEQQISAEKPDSALKILQKITNIYSKESFNLLCQLAKDKRVLTAKGFQKVNFARVICDGLGIYATQESMNTMLYLIDNQYLAPSLAAFSLARVSNVFAAHEVSDKLISNHYRQYLDSLKTFDALRSFGYARYNHFQKNYFDQEVDYYAALVATAAITDSYWWIRENAVQDMMKTNHPRALYYLATQYYKERNRTVKFGYGSEDFYTMLQSYVNERIEVKDAAGNWTSQPNDLTSKKNFLLYWSQHWDDYEWDDFLQIFVNKQQKLAQKENYERLFRRLTSTNDSVAVQSFRELSEGEPSEVIKLAGKYRSLLRNINPNIPNFKSKILENLSFLTDYCRKQNIAYAPTEKDLSLFNILLGNLSPSQRYIVENQLVEKITLSQITTFEYWAVLHETLPYANYSYSRILDKWYSLHWREILSNDKEFQLFLKKTALFARFGVVGTCNMYAKKINVKDENVKKYLQTFLNVESDQDITSLCQQFLNAAPTPKENQIVASQNSLSNDNTTIKGFVQILEKTDSISIEDINAVTQSTAYKASYRDLCLKSLSKISQVDELFLLKIQPKLSAKNGDLEYLKNIRFGYKELDDLPRIFELDDVEKIFAFMYERTETFTIDESGAFYNNIFRAAWFTNFLNSGLFQKNTAEKIKAILVKYLNESELISEFEEQATQRNIAQLENIGLPLLEKLQNAQANSPDDETKSKIVSEILARVNYDELGLIVPFMAQMNDLNGRSPLAFLSEDFGLPIFEFKSLQESNEFVQNHSKLSELELYKLYLQKFGLDFQKKDGSLDYAKIYTILKYDLVTPFSGSGGNKRDYYVYGLIKILELQFVTRLGYHYKLNENQTFYSYNSGKRVESWLKYMAENKIFRIDVEDVKAFNQ